MEVMGSSEDRQARIAELERELGLPPPPDTTLAFSVVAQQIEGLVAERERLRAALHRDSSSEREAALRDLDGRIMAAIAEVQTWTRQHSQAQRPPRERERGEWPMEIIDEGRNRWIIRLRYRDRATGAVQVRDRRIAGWRHRWSIRRLRKDIEMMHRARMGRTTSVEE
jgi:hypothetical protein